MMSVIVLARNPIVDANAILVVHVSRPLPDTFAGAVGAFATPCSVLRAAVTTINNRAGQDKNHTDNRACENRVMIKMKKYIMTNEPSLALIRRTKNEM